MDSKIGKPGTTKQQNCLRTHNQQGKKYATATNQQFKHSRSAAANQDKKDQNYPDENLPPPKKIPNIEVPHSLWGSDTWSSAQTSIKTTSSNVLASSRPTFVIHEDSYLQQDGHSRSRDQVLSDITGSTASSSSSFPLPPLPLPSHLMPSASGSSSSSIETLHGKSNSTIPDIDHILYRTSSVEFRNTCNDTIRSTSSPATDICENDVFSLVGDHHEEDLLEDETTMQADDGDEIVTGTSEEGEEVVDIEQRSPEPVPESVLIAEEYSEDILAHCKRTEVRLLLGQILRFKFGI